MMFCFFMLIFSFLSAEREDQMDPEEAAYEQYGGYVYDLEKAFARQMAEELNLFASGPKRKTGETVKTLGMQFYVPRRASMEEARALMLFVMDQYAEAVNAHEKIQPFLENKPFTYKQIEISLTFEGADLSFADGTVHSVFNVSEYGLEKNRNHLFYYAMSPCPKTTVEILNESHEEAVQRNALAPIRNLAVHQETEKEMEIDRLLSSFKSEMVKKHRIECWAVGGDMANQIEELGGLFVAVRRGTIEEARLLMVDIAENFLKTFNASEKIRPYLSGAPFPIDELKLAVNFRNREYYSFKDGSLESVRLENGKLSYYRWFTSEERKSLADPSPVQLVSSESYEEALEKAKKPQEASRFIRFLKTFTGF